MNFDHNQMFETYLKGVRTREAEGDFGSAVTFMAHAILSLVSISLKDHENPQNGVAFLVENNTSRLLEDYAKLIRSVPESEELGIFNLIGVAHTASLLSMHHMGEYLVARVQYTGSHFWNEYARALHFLATKQPYEPTLGKLVGSQKYWAVYLNFISDVTNGRDPAGSLDAMRLAFLKRQTDKRITDDGGTIVEGSARQPTHWDFRLEALKVYVTYKYGIAFAA